MFEQFNWGGDIQQNCYSNVSRTSLFKLQSPVAWTDKFELQKNLDPCFDTWIQFKT